MQLVLGGSQQMTPQKRSTQGRKMFVVSDCKKALQIAQTYIQTVSVKRGLSVITREGFANSFHDFTPGDVGIISIANVKSVTKELETMLRQLTDDAYRNVHIIIPASAGRETPVVSHIRNYFPTLKPSQRVWQGVAKFHQEITRLIPA